MFIPFVLHFYPQFQVPFVGSNILLHFLQKIVRLRLHQNMQLVTNMAEVQIFEVMYLQFCIAQSTDMTKQNRRYISTTTTTTTTTTKTYR